MRRSPSIAPLSPDNVDVYMVLDDYGGRMGRVWPEVDEERTDRRTVVRYLLEEQYNSPVRVIAFNTAQNWSRDVSEDIADELLQRLAISDDDVPAGLEDFIDQHTARAGGGTAAIAASGGCIRTSSCTDRDECRSSPAGTGSRQPAGLLLDEQNPD